MNPPFFKTLSIVAPAFNEDATLEYSHSKLCELLQLNDLKDFAKIEIVYVNDGSRDKTGQILNHLADANTNSRLQIRPIHFARNFGHSAAVLAGLETATGDVIAIIDVDLQDPPQLLGPMYQILKQNNDVVYGQRLERKDETFFKKITAWSFYRILDYLSGIAIPRDTGDFRIMTREVCDALLTCKEQMPFLRGLVAWVGFKQQSFPYVRESRKYGTTKYPLSKMIRFAMTAIVGFSTFPLKIALYMSFLVFLLSLGLLVWVFITFLNGHPVPGWTSMMAIFLFGQSMLLFVIGVIGLYIGQMHLGIQNRPRYIVKKGKNVSI